MRTVPGFVQFELPIEVILLQVWQEFDAPAQQGLAGLVTNVTCETASLLRVLSVGMYVLREADLPHLGHGDFAGDACLAGDRGGTFCYFLGTLALKHEQCAGSIGVDSQGGRSIVPLGPFIEAEE
jgi:hypothetical protein